MIKTFIRTSRLVRFKGRDVAMLLTFWAFSVVLTMFLPVVTVRFIDALSNSSDIHTYVVILIVFGITELLKLLIEGLIDLYCGIYQFKKGQDVRETLFEALFLRNGDFFLGKQTGDLIESFEYDVDSVVSYVYSFYSMFIDIFQAIGICVVLGYMEWKLLMIIIVIVPIAVVINSICNKYIAKTSSECRDDAGKQMALIEEFLSNALSIVSFGLKPVFLYRYRSSRDSFQSSNKKLLIYNELADQSISFILRVAVIVSMLYGGILVFDGEITIGVLLAFFEYADLIILPIAVVLSIKNIASATMPSVYRLEMMIEKNTKKGKDVISDCNIITFDKVSFSYERQKVFKNVSLKLKKNSIYAIKGKSGAGKSTLINLINGLWKPQEGGIYLDGINIEDLDVDCLRSLISIVSQEPFFFNDSIKNNLLISNNYNEEDIVEVLKKVGLWETIEKMPQGINTVIGDRGQALSVGQRQRLSIARSIIKDAPIIIMDEPTSAQDTETKELIYEEIKSIRDKIVCIVSHDDKIDILADYVIYIDEGTVSFS